MAARELTHEERMARLANRFRVARWVAQERAEYADVKFAADGDNRAELVAAMRSEGLAPTWIGFILNYLKRAELFGLDTLQGRQALGKALVTVTHCLETAVEIHGPMPRPGVPSGEIEDQ